MPIKDPESRRKYGREWVAARRAAYFEGKRCVRCGSTDRLELDHIDPSMKVSHSIWSWSEPRRLTEIAKCQVLCYDCHQAKSIAQMPITCGWTAYTHGTLSMYDRGCRCTPCRTLKNSKRQEQRAKKR